MKIVEKVLEKRIRVLVEVDNMQFGFMPGRGTTDALFILRSMQKVYREKDKKIVHVFCRFKKGLLIEFQRVTQWALRKKGLPEVLVKAVMSLYEGL